MAEQQPPYYANRHEGPAEHLLDAGELLVELGSNVVMTVGVLGTIVSGYLVSCEILAGTQMGQEILKRFDLFLQNIR